MKEGKRELINQILEEDSVREKMYTVAEYKTISGYDCIPIIDRVIANDLLGIEWNRKLGGKGGYGKVSFALYGIDNLEETYPCIKAALEAEDEDSIPKFDIILYYSNEYGYKATAMIKGVKLVEEIFGHMADDFVISRTFSFEFDEGTPIMELPKTESE